MKSILAMWESRYQLRSSAPIGRAMNGTERHGALLKIETVEGIGFADVHPWTEFGDQPLEVQLQGLAEKRLTKLTGRSVALAGLDRRSRSAGRSAFSGARLPENHFLVPDLKYLSTDDLLKISSDGFKTLKIKMGRSIADELAALSKVSEALGKFSLRLDFNGALTENQFSDFSETLSPRLRGVIEFVEDPIAWKSLSKTMKTKMLPLAADWLDTETLTSGLPMGLRSLIGWVIVKPAAEDPVPRLVQATEMGARVCFTSYLDHPVGQMGAMLEATQLTTKNGLGVCGLASHLVYEKSEFSERLAMNGSVVRAPEGTGIGFDDLLAKSEWRRLY